MRSYLSRPLLGSSLPGIFLLLLAAMLSGCAAKSLGASDAFTYACKAGGECAVYLTLTNPSREADALLGAETDVAAETELHRLRIDEQGALTMQRVENIPVPAADTVELKPGSLHLMLVGLTRELKAGETFALTLMYEKGGESTIEVVVTPEN
jgi:periplasmic copper chaperone A